MSKKTSSHSQSLREAISLKDLIRKVVLCEKKMNWEMLMMVRPLIFVVIMKQMYDVVHDRVRRIYECAREDCTGEEV